MILKFLLFETKLGELLLAVLERKAGLAVVQGDWLADRPAGEPKASCETPQKVAARRHHRATGDLPVAKHCRRPVAVDRARHKA